MMKALTIAYAILAKVGAIFAPPIPQAYHNWQPTRGIMEMPPMGIHTTGGMWLPVNDGKLWHGPAGSLMAVSRGMTYHRHRDTGVLVPPMQRLHPARLTPIPETPSVPSWATQEARDKQYSDAIAKVDSARLYAEHAWLYAELPILAPLDSQALSVADRTATTEKPDSALMELAELAANFDPDRTEAAIPAMISQRARKVYRLMKESE